MSISSIGSTKLRCPVCEGEKFVHPPNRAVDLTTVIVCAECGAIGEAKDFAQVSALDEVAQQVLAKARKK